MDLKGKVNYFLKSVGSSQRQLASELGLNYQHMNRNILSGKLPTEVMLGLKRLYPQIDLNWLVSEDDTLPMLIEPQQEYYPTTKSRINSIRKLLDELEKDLEEQLAQK